MFNAASCTVLLMFLLARWAGRQTSGDSPPATFNLDTCRLSSTQCNTLSSLHLRGHLSFHNTAEAARDWGRIKRLAPAGVLYPESVDDIVSLVRTAGLSRNLTVAAKGRGHSINGQAQVALQSVCKVGRRQTENSLLSVRMRVNRVCTVLFLLFWPLTGLSLHCDPFVGSGWNRYRNVYTWRDQGDARGRCRLPSALRGCSRRRALD